MNNLIKDIKLIVNNKKLLICLLCFVITICVFGGAYRYNLNKQSKGIRIGIVNNDQSEYSKLLLNFFKSNESFNELASIVEDRQEVIEAEFKSNNIDGYIIIPKDFANSLQYLENTRIKIRINGEKETETVILRAVLLSYEKYVTAVQNNAVGLYSNLKKSGLTRKENLKINLVSSWELINMAMGKELYFDYKVINVKTIGLFKHYIYVCILVVIIYFGLYVGLQLKKEQNYGVIDRYIVSGGNTFSLILSKIVINALIVSLFLITMMLVLNNKMEFVYGNYIYVCLNVMTYISFFVMLSIFISSKNVYVILANTIAIITVIVGGGIIPINYMPKSMEKLTDLSVIKIFEEQMESIKGYVDDNGTSYVYIIAIFILCILMSSIEIKRVKRRYCM